MSQTTLGGGEKVTRTGLLVFAVALLLLAAVLIWGASQAGPDGSDGVDGSGGGLATVVGLAGLLVGGVGSIALTIWAVWVGALLALREHTEERSR
ncbi:hypothetical protein K8Z61_08220 [Nocardioides sp. TRM66260-LWL]|uniref:hypothetical protein n=1 Tax=Nocardioides sp. TRM66260-LWL TaxID=2874478 RepID=UPI001CC73AF6|nr:hypothetical protein [Nocardioides sp. TRM66260-LWL]MBZ5734481.1 hypothetical protein [Nocardioides sp. TRM66260-LWL]